MGWVITGRERYFGKGEKYGCNLPRFDETFKFSP